MEQQNLPNEQGGGVTLNDGSTVVNNQSDNSQLVSISTEEPFDNQDQMEKYFAVVVEIEEEVKKTPCKRG